jgi:hypothetical protein
MLATQPMVKTAAMAATITPPDYCQGQPGSAHGKPALVERQNPVLVTRPVCRRRVPGWSRRNAVHYGGPRVRIHLPPPVSRLRTGLPPGRVQHL